MNKFGFVNHFFGVSQLTEHLPILRCLSGRALKNFVRHIPSHSYMIVDPVCSVTGVQATGIGVVCPLLPEHFVTLDPEKVLERIVSGVCIAERFGAKIVGLGGFTSVFGDEGNEVSKRVNVAITSGNTYTASLVLEGLYKAAEIMGLKLQGVEVAVIGATGDIGSICTKILSKRVRKIVLAARNEKRLVDFANKLRSSAIAEVTVAKYVFEAVRTADIVLTATSAITTILRQEDLKAGAIVCDVAYPANVAQDVLGKRGDVLIFEGGMATWPYFSKIKRKDKLRPFAPPETVHGCFAETMLLALEGRFENFSIGRGLITESRIDEIAGIARRHGFQLAPFHYMGTTYSSQMIEEIRQRASKSSLQKSILA